MQLWEFVFKSVDETRFSCTTSEELERRSEQLESLNKWLDREAEKKSVASCLPS